MSAEVALDIQEPNLFIVHGANFHVKIAMDRFNSQFDMPTQIHEAGTRAIEVFKGLNKDFHIVMDKDGEEPYVGPLLMIHLDGEDIDKSHFLLTHVLLADAGFYRDSIKMAALMMEQVKKQKEEEDRLKKEADALKDSFLKQKAKKKPKKST